MADHPRFGPAGVPPTFRLAKADLSDVPELLRKEDLDAFEYEAVRWGQKPQMKEEDAKRLGMRAEENDVWLSLHGSYFINLCGEQEVVEASRRRLIACATAAGWMKARVVVFHPGSYGPRSRGEALERCSRALQDVVRELDCLGIKNVKVGPETAGKLHQLGSLDEVLSLCETVDRAQVVIDWSHLHARDGGSLRTTDDFRKVAVNVEDRLGTQALENLHCHFSKVEFTHQGERCHHALGEKRYGPDFNKLAEVIVEFRLRPVIISESPVLDLDAIRMRDILQERWRAE